MKAATRSRRTTPHRPTPSRHPASKHSPRLNARFSPARPSAGHPRPNPNLNKQEVRNVAIWLAIFGLLGHYLPLGSSGLVLMMIPAWIIAERRSLRDASITLGLASLIHFVANRPADGAPVESIVLVGAAIGAIYRVHWQASHIKAMRFTADRDHLTGALTRTALELVGEAELKKCIHKGEVLSLAVVDCDHFKQLNDKHGHAFGDEVLRSLVNQIRVQLDNRCHIGRTGGDEFVVIFPGLSSNEAIDRLKRAMASFADETFRHGAKASFSFGMSETSQHGFIWNRLIEAADQSMYMRKSERRASAKPATSSY